jgi:hypothetical protein
MDSTYLHHPEKKNRQLASLPILEASISASNATHFPCQKSQTFSRHMGYYLMPLSEDAKKLCVISLPLGLYQYNMLPMEIKPATDIF